VVGSITVFAEFAGVWNLSPPAINHPFRIQPVRAQFINQIRGAFESAATVESFRNGLRLDRHLRLTDLFERSGNGNIASSTRFEPVTCAKSLHAQCIIHLIPSKRENKCHLVFIKTEVL